MKAEASGSGFAPINNAHIYYELAGAGQPLVMVHAGVADSRQWNSDFAFFQTSYRVLRYDLRGYGKSEPVDGDFSHMSDLTALLEHLHIDEPLFLMGCSMGGSLCLEFALANPSQSKALIMVDAGPSGLKLDVPNHPKADDVEKAFNDGDLDLVAEIETQIWFDGMDRTAGQVNQSMRQLVREMDRRVLELETRNLGKRLPDATVPAVERLAELTIPVLIIVGAHDTPFMQAAANYMVENLPRAEKVTIRDAAHLPNLEHPDEFQEVVTSFLRKIKI